MKKCVICGELLSVQNKSKEHIIHNAIGGSLEDDEIYCKSCNESCGSNNDKAFTKIFAPIVSKIKMQYTNFPLDHAQFRYRLFLLFFLSYAF